MAPQKNKMLPQSYQTIFRKHLSEQQYLTLELLLLLIQAHQQVKLSTLASLFPQAITYERISLKVLAILHCFYPSLLCGDS